MKAAKRTTGWAVLLFGAMILGFPVAAREQVKSDAFANLVAAYSPQPQEYPTGKEYAQPDTSVPFRWHFYHDGAIERFEDAKRLLHADAYNPLEDAQDVYVERHSPVKFAMTGEHVTQGKQALRVDFPARAIQTGKAGVWIKANSGPPSFSPYFKSLTCVWSYHR